MATFTTATLLHNPRCSKSRQALAYLQENNIDVDVREYLKLPLTRDEIESLFVATKFEHPLTMMRTKEAEFKQAGLSKASTKSEVLEALVNYPKLLERPIYVKGDIAAIGRPLENIITVIAESTR